jgi:Inositol 1,4,5-trisphosphate/ryanodine receptor
MGNKVGFEARLDHWISSRLVFTIRPKFKSRKNGDTVINFDDVILESKEGQYNLDIAEDLPYFINDYTGESQIN